MLPYSLVGFGLGLLRLFLLASTGMSSSSLSLEYLPRGVGRGATRRDPVWEGEEGKELGRAIGVVVIVSSSGWGLLIMLL